MFPTKNTPLPSITQTTNTFFHFISTGIEGGYHNGSRPSPTSGNRSINGCLIGNGDGNVNNDSSASSLDIFSQRRASVDSPSGGVQGNMKSAQKWMRLGFRPAESCDGPSQYNYS